MNYPEEPWLDAHRNDWKPHIINNNRQQQQQQQWLPIQTLEESAKDHALKMDFYTDILDNLSWPKQQEPRDANLPIHHVLSQLPPLQILLAPEGRFLHLGSTHELVDIVTLGAYPDPNSIANTIAALALPFLLQPCYELWINPQPHCHS
jgi:hypothetical protein